MPRAITVVAVLLGGVIGTVAALLNTPMSNESAVRSQEPSSASSELAGAASASAMTSVQLGATPTPEPALRAAPPARARARAEPLGPDALEEAKLHCSWGAPGDCLRVARAYLRENPKDLKRARPYQQLAVSLYARECKARDPVACKVLAQLYTVGEGVSPNMRQARALEQRVVVLCRMAPSPPCAELLGSDEVR